MEKWREERKWVSYKIYVQSNGKDIPTMTRKDYYLKLQKWWKDNNMKPPPW